MFFKEELQYLHFIIIIVERVTVDVSNFVVRQVEVRQRNRRRRNTRQTIVIKLEQIQQNKLVKLINF
jgi:hypothetical protein